MRYRWLAVTAWDLGDIKCWQINREKAEYLRFAAQIMNGVPIDDTEHGCETLAFATEIADYADCICNVCDCPTVDVDCTIAPAATVDFAVAEADLPNPCTLLLDAVLVAGCGIAEANGIYYYLGTMYGGYKRYEKSIPGTYVGYVRVQGGAWQIIGSSTGDDWQYDDESGNPTPDDPWDVPASDFVAFDIGMEPNPTEVRQATGADLGPCVTVPDGESYYMLDGDNAGSVLTWSEADNVWVVTAIAQNDIVLSEDDGQYYTDIGDGPGYLFPPPIVTLQAGTTYVTVQATPGTADGRTIQLQGLRPQGWYNIGPPWNEADLPQSLNLNGLIFTEVRLHYTLANGCEYNSEAGTIIPPPPPADPCSVQPQYTANLAVDVSQYNTPLPAGPYLIVSNEYGLTNPWTVHLNEIQNTDGSYTALAEGEVVLVLNTSVYWRLIDGAMAPLFPPLTATMTLVPGGYMLTSDYPMASAADNRDIIVEGLQGVDWVPMWFGQENYLPQQLSTAIGMVTALRATYVVLVPGETEPCLYEVTGTVDNPDTNVVTTDCQQIEYGYYRYTSGTDTYFLFTAPPGETITLTFIAGTMGTGVVINSYSGTDITGDPIPSLTGTFPNLAAASGTSTGENLFVFVNALSGDPNEDAEQTTWWFQAVCTQPTTAPSGAATPVNDCDNWQFSINVDIVDIGDQADVTVEYVVNGGTPQTAGPFGVEIAVIGPFDIGDEVLVTLLHQDNPLSNAILGLFVAVPDECDFTEDPCAPEGAQKVNSAGDLADLPFPPADPGGFVYLVVSDNTNIGTYPVGEFLLWDGVSAYEPISFNPGIIASQSPPTWWVSVGPGVQPYPLFPTPIMSPTGSSPLNWTLVLPEILQFGITTNRPMQLQVRQGFGQWQDVVGFMEQDLRIPYAINVPMPFDQARIVWDYLTCGLTGGVIIDLTP